MIGYLTGRAEAGGLVVVGGVGYLVATAAPLPVGEDVALWIHTAVRENDISLFGFTSPAERDLFACLTKVTGVGAKLALGILSIGAGAVVAAVAAKDAAALAKAPGIGVAKARTLLASVSVPAELAAQFADSGASASSEIVDALAAMGFDASAARSVLDDLTSAGETDEGVLLRRAMVTLRMAS